jgi:hypothetical protein
MLDHGSAVASPAADVYSLAASMWQATTGCYPVDYGHGDAMPPAVDRRRLIAQGSPPLRALPRHADWPALYKLLGEILRGVPADRPTAAELAETLERL